jgi:type I restriction enzyme, S subunit
MTNSLPSNWQLVKVGRICDINPRAQRELPLSTPVSFVPMSAVDEVLGDIIKAEERPAEEVYRGYTPFADGDVLFAKITPCMQNGKAAIARNLRNGVGFGSTEFHVLRPKPVVLTEWIFHFVRREPFRQAAAASFTGTAGQQRVPPEFIANALIPLPPLSEQRRVVEILQEAEAVRRLSAEADRKTAELIPAMFHEMFGDPEVNERRWPTELLSGLGELDRVVQDIVLATSQVSTEVLIRSSRQATWRVQTGGFETTRRPTPNSGSDRVGCGRRTHYASRSRQTSAQQPS